MGSCGVCGTRDNDGKVIRSQVSYVFVITDGGHVVSVGQGTMMVRLVGHRSHIALSSSDGVMWCRWDNGQRW